MGRFLGNNENDRTRLQFNNRIDKPYSGKSIVVGDPGLATTGGLQGGLCTTRMLGV